MSTRNGKIGRLPYSTRQELNERLLDGEQGQALLDWLNAEPEVKECVAKEFGGELVTKQNLSAWRLGGFAEWDRRRELLGQVDELAEWRFEMEGSTQEGLADDLATMVMAQYAALLMKWDGKGDQEFEQRLKGLRELSVDVSRLQRGAHRLARLEMAKEKHGWAEFEFEKGLAELQAELERRKSRQRVMLSALKGMKARGEWEEPEKKSMLELQREQEEMEKESGLIAHERKYAAYVERRKQARKARNSKGQRPKSKPVQTEAEGSLKFSVSSVQSREDEAAPTPAEGAKSEVGSAAAGNPRGGWEAGVTGEKAGQEVAGNKGESRRVKVGQGNNEMQGAQGQVSGAGPEAGAPNDGRPELN